MMDQFAYPPTVGFRAGVIPFNHYKNGGVVTNYEPVITSLVLAVDPIRKIFETRNTIYHYEEYCEN
jgi:hypothetical protein